jgi:hypothetical protein
MGSEKITWQFTGNKHQKTDQLPAIGETLRFTGEIIPRRNSFELLPTPHQAMEHQAVHWGHGTLLHMMRWDRHVSTGKGGGVYSEITGLAAIDAEELLKRFAVDQVMSVSHLWGVSMPEPVLDYLAAPESDKLEKAESAFLPVYIEFFHPGSDSRTKSPAAAAWTATSAIFLHNPQSAERATAWASRAMGLATETDDAAVVRTATAIWTDAMTEFDRRVYDAFRVKENGDV